MLVTILMPSLNEELAIGKTLDNIPTQQLTEAGFQVEILIVDGGSNDRTVEIVKNKGVKIITCKKGYGLQYQEGFKNCQGEIIVTADSDGSYPMERIPDLLKIFIDAQLEFITVNRFASLGSKSMRLLNRIGNAFLTLVTNLIFSLNLKDSQSGMWIIKKEGLNKLFLVSEGMAFSEEIKIEAFNKLKSKEIQGSYYKRIGGSKLRIIQDGWSNLIFLFKKSLN